MSDLKGRIKRVDEMSWTSSFFLCPAPSARHFKTFYTCKLNAITQRARHLMSAVTGLSDQTIYTGGRNIVIHIKSVILAAVRIFKASISKILAFAGMKVTEHA